MACLRAVAAVLAVLTITFAAAMGYLAVNPVKTTVVSTSTATQTLGAAYTVNIAYKSGVGFYLTNGSDFTLYFRSADTLQWKHRVHAGLL